MKRVIELIAETGLACDPYKTTMELPDNWESMSESEQQEFIDSEALEWAVNNGMDWGGAVIEVEDDHECEL